MNDFNSPDYKRSRKAYVAQQTAEYFVSLLVTDAFLAKLLTSMGISDAMIGIISSFITIAFVFQLMSVFLLRLKVSAKKLVILFDTLSIFFFMFLYFIPFLTPHKTLRTVLVTLSVFGAYVGKYFIYSICFKWANSYVDPTRRARFSANKEMISLFTGMFFTMAVGYIIDKFEALGNIEGGFLFLGIGILILNICNFTCLAMIKRDKEEDRIGDRQPLKVVAKNTLGNKNFRSVIIVGVLTSVASHFTTGFLGVFKTKDLMMSILMVQIVNIIANFARILVSKPIAKYSDKFSYARGMELGFILCATSFIMIMFTTKTTWYFIIIYQILHNCSVAGTNQNSYNIAYSYVDSKYITQAMAIKNCISGICGFISTIAGAKILSVIQANGNMFFGIPVYAQQVLAGITVVIYIIAIIYSRKVVGKQKVMIQ